jgi:hypothetical protein
VNTTPEYVPYLLAGQVTAGRQAGVDLYGVGRELYVSNLSVLALIGMVVKALNDHGIVLDAEWLTRLNAAYAGPWPADLLNQIDPNREVP